MKLAPDWRRTGAREHFVQFYRTEDELLDSLSSYVADGLWAGETAVVIATPIHRLALDLRLQDKRIDVATHRFRRQYLALDARETMARFIVAGQVRHEPFHQFMSDVFRDIAPTGRAVRAFGEMVALLWMEGNASAAIELESLWNKFAENHAFRLFCAYPAACRERDADGFKIEDICNCHSVTILPAPG